MKVFGLQFDKQNIENSNEIQRRITKIFLDLARDLSRAASNLNIELDGDKPFRVEDNPILERWFKTKTDSFVRQLLGEINSGTKKQWELANVKNDALVDFFRGNTKFPVELIDKWKNHNMEALKVFQSRKTDGRNLSDRVWETAEALKGNVGMAIDIALTDGRSANELSRDVRQYLIEPEKLFRRVRDKHGGLHLSKEAKKYSPGPGVYRSSYKNAMRLARTEINMAYRTADNDRIQKLDFVVGIEIRRSNNVYECDVCNSLVGKYPKDFKFTGWHPQCRCFVLSILSTKDEFVDQMKALLSGEEIEHKDAKELWKDFKSKEFDVSKKFKDTEDQKFITGKPILSVEIGNPNERGRVSIEVPVTMVVDGRNIKMNNSQGFLEGSFDKERGVFTVTKIDVNEELRNQGVARQLMEQAKGNLPKGYTIEMSGVFSDDGKKFNQSLIDSGFFNTSTKGIDSENTVYDTPPNFKKWVADNADSIEASKEKGTTPFWMQDNKNAVHRALNEERIKRKAEEERKLMAERRAERDKREEEKRKENERLGKLKHTTDDETYYKTLTNEQYQEFSDEMYDRDYLKSVVSSTRRDGYVGTVNSMYINEYHRTGKYNGRYDIDNVNLVTKALDTLIEDNQLRDNISMVRFLGNSMFKDIIGNPYEYWRLGDSAKADLLSKAIGTTLIEKGFFSCSTDIKANVFTERPFRLDISIKKGMNAYFADHILESEVILGRGTTLKITGFEILKSQTVVKVEVIK